MLVKSLEKMESIVEFNKNLSWDGWDVLELKKSPTAWMNVNGVFRKNSWYLQTKYVLSEAGWEIPAKFGGKNEQR